MEITEFIAKRREALLVNDYNAYRAQLSRQLLAARKRLGRATHKREKFAAKPVTAQDVGTDHEFAHLLLLTSERAWAHAMHIKSSHTEDASGKGITGPTRSHIISRLAKAAKTAQELTVLLSDKSASKSNDQDLLECRAYHASLAGAEQFEKQQSANRSDDAEHSEKRWQACLELYSQARVIYAALLEKEKKDIYRELLANTVDPTIRYAAYQAHLSRTIPIPTVAKRFFPKDDPELVSAVEKLDSYALKDRPVKQEEQDAPAAEQEIPTSITWRGRKANIVDASIGQALANVASAESRLQSYLASHPNASAKDKAAAYDELLIASQDAVDATKRATDELEKERIDEGDRRMQDLRVTSLYVNCELVSWRVGRNRVLIGGEDDGLAIEVRRQRKPKRQRTDGTDAPEKEEPRGRKLARLRERVVLFDAIIQSITSIKEMRGTMRDANFVEELDGRSSYFQALKCVNISHSHDLLDNQVNALALLHRAQTLLKTAASGLQSANAAVTSIPSLSIDPTTLKATTTAVDRLVARMHAIVEMRNIESTAAKSAAKNAVAVLPVAQRLHGYPTPGSDVDLSGLVAYPPKYEPVAVKPIFLDVAFNYIEYPGRSAAQVVQSAKPASGDSADAEKQATPKKGWFGFGR